MKKVKERIKTLLIIFLLIPGSFQWLQWYQGAAKAYERAQPTIEVVRNVQGLFVVGAEE